MTIPELATLEAWQSTPHARRDELARDLAARHGLAFERLEPFRRDDLPLASYRGLDGLFRFVLVPGGTFDMGLSDAERAYLASLAEPHRGEPTFQETWGNLLAEPSPFRPVVRVTVEPCLVAQSTMADFGLDQWRSQWGEAFVGEGGDTSSLPEDLEVAFAAHGFRLPTEAEWEWCARGGRSGEITFKGNVVPDARYLRKISLELDRSAERDEARHARAANDFGLLGFGVDAELCRNRYAVPPDLTPGAPGDFEGRVVRGGAGTMGQNPGEWQALLTAFRRRAAGLLDDVGVRPVRSIG